MKLTRILKVVTPCLLIGIFALLCYFSQINKSVTVDEFSHLPSGIYNLITFDWRMDRESPPLIKCFPALTAIITKPIINVKPFLQNPNTWSFGYDFMYRNQEKYITIFNYGRCAIIFMACLGGWVLFRFSEQLFGFKGALISLLLYCFNPNIIAHSRLTTIDIGASVTILLSVYCFWKFLKAENNVSVAVIAGIALGLAQLSKFTALLLYPIFIFIFGLVLLNKIYFNSKSKNFSSSHVFSGVYRFLLMLMISVIVINIGYLFSGTFTPIREFLFQSEPLKRLSSLMWEAFPVPLPFDYLKGFDSQLAISSGNNSFYASYLMGKYSLTGWWHYYIVAFFVKNPVSLIVITLATVLVWLARDTIKPDLETVLCVWTPIIAFFLYFSFLARIQIGLRFILPIFPLMFLAAGAIAANPMIKHKAIQACLGALLLTYILSCMHIHPNYLSYFNFISGGPREGCRWLIDSNLDWGQDLPALKRYMQQNKIDKIKLGYFGRVHPGLYGIDYELAKQNPTQGVHAISASFLAGRPYYLLEKNAKLHYCDSNYFKIYNNFEPIALVGHSIFIFNITDS